MTRKSFKSCFNENEYNLYRTLTPIILIWPDATLVPSWEMAKQEEKESEFKEKKAEAAKTKKAVKEVQGKVEKTTLGDLGVLAELKKKMEGGE